MMTVDYAGGFSSHTVHHKKTWTIDETVDKKRKDKEKRKATAATKVAQLAAAAAAFNAQPELAPNPFAAARAAGDVAVGGLAGGGGGGGGAAAAPDEAAAVFAAAYGVEDARAVAQNRGEADFMWTAVAVVEEDPQEEGEVFAEATEEGPEAEP